jgi:hypothetical protein
VQQPVDQTCVGGKLWHCNDLTAVPLKSINSSRGAAIMLTRADEWPIHQTPEPVAFAGTDRNFYDRYFFCGYLDDGSGFFAVAFGIYPNLNVADAHVSVLRGDGTQTCLHASRLLGMERMELSVGPIRIEVLEPLSSLRVVVEETDGIALDLICTGRAAPLQEPRFTRRNGSRLLMDVTRFTQNVRWSGSITINGRTTVYTPQTSFGTRDRSWGIRPIGSPDAQPTVPAKLPQFYWLWGPANFPNLSLFYHVNDDESGVPWNTRCELIMDSAGQGAGFGLSEATMRLTYKPGTRRVAQGVLTGKDGHGGLHKVVYSPTATFAMKGIGYQHPKWAHGLWQGDLKVEREDFTVSDGTSPDHTSLHVQAICTLEHEGPNGLGSQGVGLLEQLIIGPHAPSGFTDLLDPAPSGVAL